MNYSDRPNLSMPPIGPATRAFASARRRKDGLISAPAGFLIVGVVIASLTGCSTSRHCQGAGAAVAKYQLQTNSVQDALRVRAEAPREQVDMLVLSGGGSHGAWGAGVLRGWRDNAVNPRPKKFQVVTGVSTGALLATYAFLGQPEDDDLLERAYTSVQTSEIYRHKFLPFALLSDSLYSSSPLARTIAKYLTQETVDRVARAGREEHRRLYVGTVNLDAGGLVIWDLTAIAMDESNVHRLDLYRRVVLASASIPIMVPPVNIDGNLYVDGGARAQLFFERHFFPALRQIKERGILHPNLTIHIIVNGKLGVEPVCVNDWLKDVALRTLEMLLDANAIGDLYRIKYLLDLNHYGHFRLSFIPPDVAVTTSDVFDPKMMRALYDAGLQFGKTRAKWDDSIPDPDFHRR